MFIQSSGVVPKAADRRSAMLAEIPDLLFNTRERVTRVTRRWAAAADTAMSPRYSRSTRPGCGGLCMALRTSSMIAGRYHFVSAETPGPSTRLVALSATSSSLGMTGLGRVPAFHGRGRPRHTSSFGLPHSRFGHASLVSLGICLPSAFQKIPIDR